MLLTDWKYIISYHINRGSDTLSLGLDLTDFGWRVGGGCVKAILSPGGNWAWAELGKKNIPLFNPLCRGLGKVLRIHSLANRKIP